MFGSVSDTILNAHPDVCEIFLCENGGEEIDALHGLLGKTSHWAILASCTVRDTDAWENEGIHGDL